jgi:hypothetical protein
MTEQETNVLSAHRQEVILAQSLRTHSFPNLSTLKGNDLSELFIHLVWFNGGRAKLVGNSQGMNSWR